MKKFVYIMLIIIGVGIVGGLGFSTYCIATSPTINPKNIYSNIDKSSFLYDDKGELIDTVYYDEDRKIISSEDMPEDLKSAFIAIEDKTFYEHHGLNIKRMIGAIVDAIKTKGSISGTSTITQQLARNVYLANTKSDRTLKRKIVEIWYSFQLEKNLTKDEILEAYINTIYMGYGCYGINAAAQTYFSKDVSELTLKEGALLAALPQSPDSYALIKDSETEYTTKINSTQYANSLVEDRRDLVLDLMVEQGYITKEDAENAKVPVKDILKPSTVKRNSDYTYFKDYLIEQVKADLMSEYSLSEKKAEEMVYTGGLNIYSTIDSEAQHAILDEFEHDYNFPSAESKVQSAMVITEVGTGKIKAMVGGRNASGEKLFNRATSPRQPGSSIKPLSVYGAALQKSFEYAKKDEKFEFTNYGFDNQGTKYWGDYITANSTVVDERLYIGNECWPKNANGYFSGWRTFRTAIQQSLNTCAVKILYQIDMDYSAKMVKKFGITTLETDTSKASNDMNAAALALGGMTHGVTPLEMSLAYATFPNGGVRNSAVCYTKVVDSEGHTILEGESEKTKVLDEGVAWIMTDVLKSVVTSGIARSASIYGVQVGGKTGTTNDTYDAWFCGFTPSYSAALWIGTDDNKEMSNGSGSATVLWSKIMSKISKAKKGNYKAQPNNVVYVGREYYTKGTQPEYSYNYSSSTSRNNETEETTEESTEDNNTEIEDFRDTIVE